MHPAHPYQLRPASEGDGVFVDLESGSSVYVGRPAENAGQLYVRVCTEDAGLHDNDHHDAPVVQIELNDATLYDHERPPEPEPYRETAADRRRIDEASHCPRCGSNGDDCWQGRGDCENDGADAPPSSTMTTSTDRAALVDAIRIGAEAAENLAGIDEGEHFDAENLHTAARVLREYAGPYPDEQPADPPAWFDIEETSPGGGAPLLDHLASLARTMLTDPRALVNVPEEAPRWEHELYVVNQLDRIIETLNPSTETRSTMAGTLRALGLHLAERMDECRARRDNDGTDETDAVLYNEAADQLDQALDHIDAAIRSMEDAETDDDEDEVPIGNPYGRCDRCGSPCDDHGCTLDRTHAIASA